MKTVLKSLADALAVLIVLPAVLLYRLGRSTLGPDRAFPGWSQAFALLPGEEDFGIVPVEAQACGRPVVALARGGALETIVDGVTGVLVDGTAPDAWAGAVRRVRDGLEAGTAFQPERIRRHAEGFSRDRFLAAMAAEIDAVVEAPAAEGARW